MGKWTESRALAALNGDTSVKDKTIINKGGFKGLKACAAYDYLSKYCGYKGIIR